jgi:hypothetical protein
MASAQDYMRALMSAIKRRDKETTKALLRPYVKAGGKTEDLFKIRKK